MIPLANDPSSLARVVRSWGPLAAAASANTTASSSGSIDAFISQLVCNNTSTSTERLLGRVSETCGVLSLSVWLFAQLPQIIENYVNQSVHGVSVAFLMCWIAGDITNLLGCILTRALPFQTCLAAYYCFIDCILSLQFWYYTRVYPRQKVHHNLLQSPNMLRSPLANRHGHLGLRRNRFDPEVAPHSPIDISSGFHANENSMFQKLLSTSFLAGSFKKANGLPTEPLTHLSPGDIGMCSAWLCSFLYLASRSPQIVKNFRSKSTKGISTFLFLFAMMGNLFYTISIVSDLYLLSISDYEFRSDNKFRTVLMAQLPFIVGSAGTVLFDCVILFQ
ncbi:uncharacterized protein CANTADRAFT_51685, partial [Suhomyces tanzawaensis NRRL Y-17324]